MRTAVAVSVGAAASATVAGCTTVAATVSAGAAASAADALTVVPDVRVLELFPAVPSQLAPTLSPSKNVSAVAACSYRTAVTSHGRTAKLLPSRIAYSPVASAGAVTVIEIRVTV